MHSLTGIIRTGDLKEETLFYFRSSSPTLSFQTFSIWPIQAYHRSKLNCKLQWAFALEKHQELDVHILHALNDMLIRNCPTDWCS